MANSSLQQTADATPQLGVDDLGGVLLRIYDRNHHDRIGLLNFSSGNYCWFFAAERTFCLSVHS